MRLRKIAARISQFVILVAGSTLVTHAGPIDNLTTFTAGTPAVAADVNGNFNAVEVAVDDNDARIAALETQNSALVDEIALLRTELNNVLAINQYLSLETVNDNPAVRITGANLQLVNGLGETATANGTGNVVIGYDEQRDPVVYAGLADCSIGTNFDNDTAVTNESECAAAGGTWAVNHKSGSHYLIVGIESNYSRWGGLVAGFSNSSNNNYSTASGGARNVASGQFSSVSGGVRNRASGNGSSVDGGNLNLASGNNSNVNGGASNIAIGSVSNVSGGSGNVASGDFSNVSGGQDNEASGRTSVVSGGQNRTAAGQDDWGAGSLTEDN